MAERLTQVLVNTTVLAVDIGDKETRENVAAVMRPNADRSEVTLEVGPVTLRFNVVELRAAVKLATDP